MSRKVIAIIGLVFLLFAVTGVIARAYTPITIEAARIAGDKARTIELKGRELGLVCTKNAEDCAELIARVEKNSQLKSAILKAKAMDVWIIPERKAWFLFSVGSVGPGYVNINTRCSDEEIITFLTN